MSPPKSDSNLSILRPEQLLGDDGLMTGMELVLDGDRIAQVRPATGPVDLPRRALLPGFVNAHSHAFQRGLRGHVQWARGDDDFWSWRERMYGLANGLDADGIEAISALAFLEMVESGFTSVGEFHYLHHLPEGMPYADREELALRVVRAARRVGLRIRLLRVAYHRGGPGQDRSREQRRFCDDHPEQVLDAIRRLEARGVPAGLAPHSVRAVPREWLEAFSDFDGIVHAHVSEQPRENTQCLAEHGMTPTGLFYACGLLSERFTAVHMTFPEKEDAERLRETGARVCACPTTELDLGDGFLPLDHLHGVPICIGTDSHAQIDPFAEIKAIELHARGCQGRRNVLAPPDEPDGLALELLRIGSLEGARSLGFEAGALRPGLLADLITVDLEHLLMVGARPLPTIALSGHPGLVREAWVGGQQVLSEGRSPQREAVIAEALAALERYSSESSTPR